MTPAAITVAIIGAGPLGRQLALHAARAGFCVVLEDVMPANLRHAEESLREQLGPAAMPLVSFAGTVEDAVRQADLAIDCVPDELESKLEIFSLLDRMAPPRTILCTPTNALSITDLASCTYRADRCVALRGSLIGGPADILRSRFVEPPALKAVAALLARIGIASQVVEDVEPMLVKNQ